MKNNISEFQKKVYAAVSRIPRGKVTTYKFLAETIGCNSARAVGQALKRNPFAPEVPCHRVISSSLSIGGFQGNAKGRAIAVKKALLEAENVKFVNGKLADKSLIVSRF